MPAIGKPVHVFSEFAVDHHIDQCRLDLRRLVRCDTVKARRHRVPIAAQIGVHELGLIGQPAQRIAEDRRTLARLHDTEIDLFVVESGVLLLMRRRRTHEDRAGDAARRRIAVKVGRRLIDLVRGGGRAIDVAGDNRLPGHVEIMEQFRLHARRTHRHAARHDHH